MTVGFPLSRAPLRAPLRRLHCALALSAALHVLFVYFLPHAAPQGSAAARITVPLLVRLEAAAGREPDEPAPTAEAAPGWRDEPKKPQGARTARRAEAQAQEPARAPAPPQPTDPTYYSARELDEYPRPVAPFEFEALVVFAPQRAALRVRAVLRIDEHGTVTGVELLEPDPPGRLGEELRSMLLAARFYPARRQERAVRSRIVLSVNLGASSPAEAATAR